MANILPIEKKDQIKKAFYEGGSIKQTSRITGVSRNTVRALLREEGLSIPPSLTVVTNDSAPPVKSHQDPPTRAIDFSYLQKFFELSKDRVENIKFETELKNLSVSIRG